MIRKLFMLLLLFFALSVSVAAAEGGEITKKASFSGKNRGEISLMTDRNYKTRWTSGRGQNAYLEVSLPESAPCGTVYIQWYETPIPFRIMTQENGQWVTLCEKTECYYNAAVTLPSPQTRFRICPAEGCNERMVICEIHLYAPGEVPGNVQFWQPTVEKADLMLLVCHPDDEVLWFGGALPTYAGEQKKDVLVCVMVLTMPYRRCELLDSLWTCGVRTYPIWGGLGDKYSTSLKKQYTMWSETRLLKKVTGWYRQYKPTVVLTHDIRGEYGHGGHRVCADLCIKALALSADAKYDPSSAKEWGLWDVPKLYVHLYDKGVIEMPWDTPLSAFGGKTGFEVAKEAFKCHVSQQSTDYAVRNTGSCTCTRFGLYRSLVGEDTEKNDFFENTSPAETQDGETETAAEQDGKTGTAP